MKLVLLLIIMAISFGDLRVQWVHRAFRACKVHPGPREIRACKDLQVQLENPELQDFRDHPV